MQKLLIKKINYILAFLITFMILPIVTYATIGSNSSLPDINVYLITDDCSKCIEAEQWLKEISEKNVRLNITKITKESEEYKKLNINLKLPKRYPLFVIGTTYFWGYNENVKGNIESAIDKYLKSDNYCDPLNTELDFKACQKQNKEIYSNDKNSFLIILMCSGLIIILAKLILFKVNKN